MLLHIAGVRQQRGGEKTRRKNETVAKAKVSRDCRNYFGNDGARVSGSGKLFNASAASASSFRFRYLGWPEGPIAATTSSIESWEGSGLTEKPEGLHRECGMTIDGVEVLQRMGSGRDSEGPRKRFGDV